MRLDKFLKVSRIIKRRTLAKEFAESERVMINGRVAKPSSEVTVGDTLTVRVAGKETSYQILKIVDNVKAADAKDLYKIVE